MSYTPNQLINLLGSVRYRFEGEWQLQEGISQLFEKNGIAFAAEVSINEKDRLDFLVGRIAVETKIKGSLADVTRQLHRYAQNDSVDAILLVTTRQCHREIPNVLNGKPVGLLWLGGLSL